MSKNSLLFLFVFLFFSSAYAENYCSFILAGPVQELFKDVKDVYPKPNHQTTFDDPKLFQIHKRFKISRVNNRIVLAAKSQAIAKILIKDISRYTKIDAKKAFVYTGFDFPLMAWDITDILNETIRSKLGLKSNVDGPNCWNLCLVHSGIAQDEHSTYPTEFTHWLKSSLAEEILDPKDLEPGDIVAIRHDERRGETHGFIYISPRIVLSKNGASKHSANELLDINEVGNLYLSHPWRAPKPLNKEIDQKLDELMPDRHTPPGPYLYTVQAFRLKPIEVLWQQLKGPIPNELSKLWTEILIFEKQHARYIQESSSTAEHKELIKSIQDYRLKVKAMIDDELLKLQKSKTHRSKVLKDLWKGAELRLKSLSQNL